MNHAKCGILKDCKYFNFYYAKNIPQTGISKFWDNKKEDTYEY